MQAMDRYFILAREVVAICHRGLQVGTPVSVSQVETIPERAELSATAIAGIRKPTGVFVHRVPLRHFVVAVAATLILSACAAPRAPNMHGRWRPVNQYAEAPVAIPLQQSYQFQASPMDGTLKTLLSRWAKDLRMNLSYLHPNDYTLYGPVAQIRTADIQQAVGALSDAYAAQGLVVVVESGQIIVRSASHAQ